MNNNLFEVVDKVKEPNKQVFKLSREHLILVEFEETFEIEADSVEDAKQKLFNSINNEEYLFKHTCKKLKTGSVFKNDDLRNEPYDEKEER